MKMKGSISLVEDLGSDVTQDIIDALVALGFDAETSEGMDGEFINYTIDKKKAKKLPKSITITIPLNLEEEDEDDEDEE